MGDPLRSLDAVLLSFCVWYAIGVPLVCIGVHVYETEERGGDDREEELGL